MSRIETRIRKAEKCLGSNEESEADNLTVEEVEELRAAMWTAWETGVPLVIPTGQTPEQGEKPCTT